MIELNGYYRLSAGTNYNWAPTKPHLLESVGIKYIQSMFPSNEMYIRIDESEAANIGDGKRISEFEFVTVELKWQSQNDVMGLLLIVDALRRIKRDIKLVLNIAYLPYGRQDKTYKEGEAASLKVFANLINSLNFHKVLIIDPHSDVALALIDNSEEVSVNSYIEQAYLAMHNADFDADNFYIVSPDAGAYKRLSKLKFIDRDNLDMLVCTKKRINGNVVGTDILNYRLIKPNRSADFHARNKYLIIDDICDGGATFLGIARAIYKYDSNATIALYVTHGIFSKGISELKSVIKYIITVNNMNNTDGVKSKEYNISKIFESYLKGY